MMKRRVQLLILITLTISGMVQAQRTQPQQVLVQSWQKGTETVFNQVMQISLGPKQNEYAVEVVGISGKKYKLRIVHNPLSSVKTEHWKVELREVILTNEGKETLGDNLLLAERPGPGGDHFPREDFVGYLYPENEVPVVRVAGIPLVEGFPFYPLKTTRKIRVDGFHLIIKVEKYQFSNKDKTKLDHLDLTIEFRGGCEQT